MRFIFIILFTFTLSNIVKAQTELTQKENFQTIEPAPKGTFQILSKTKITEVFTKEKFAEIQILVSEKRQEDEEVILDFSIYSIIKIPSKKEINSKDFLLLETFPYNSK